MEKYDPLAINYKMDTLEDILSIPVPTEKFELPDDFMDSIEYVLQRKATEFKKEGNMECAIACLEKAVEIIPFSPMPYPDCFERLEKYLKLNNQWDEAEEVSLEGAKQEKNFQNEFKNKVLSDATKLGTDLLEASYHEPASAKEAMYRGRVFSISGSDTRFPVLPEDFWETRLSACSFIWGISEPLYCDPDRIIAFSNRPFIDNRGNIEKAAYEKYASEMRLKKETEKEYFWILKHLPRIAPKSLNGYSRMKNSNSRNFQKIRKMAMEKGLEFADTSKENISKKEILRTCWGDYEMPDPYILDIRKGPRYDLKKIKEDEL